MIEFLTSTVAAASVHGSSSHGLMPFNSFAMLFIPLTFVGGVMVLFGLGDMLSEIKNMPREKVSASARVFFGVLAVLILIVGLALLAFSGNLAWDLMTGRGWGTK